MTAPDFAPTLARTAQERRCDKAQAYVSDLKWGALDTSQRHTVGQLQRLLEEMRQA